MAFWSASSLPKPYFAKRGEETVREIAEAAKQQKIAGLAKHLKRGETKALVKSLAGNSHYFRQLLTRFPGFFEKMITQQPEALFDRLLEDAAKAATEAEDLPSLMRVLRRFKGKLALLEGTCEVTGRWGIEEGAERLSRGADVTLRWTLAHLLHRAMAKGELAWPKGKPEAPSPKLAKGSGFVVLALGKHGGKRLNFSSDIDLILLFDQDKVRYRGAQTPGHCFTKLAQDMVRVMQERTEDGYAFRIDLRLRPDPATTPPAVSFAAAEAYYQSTAETWERAAMTKARICAGDAEAGADFLSRIRHFMWRRRLDFAAVQDIHSIKNRILSHYGHRQIALPGHDIKIGEGGIRSVEFFCQIHQLLAGGRDPSLRVPQTVGALKALAAARIIDKATAEQLAEAYLFLRTLEHRMQMIGDEQTHALPTREEVFEHLALFMGSADAKAFKSKVLGALSIVKRHYDALPGTDGDETPQFLADHGLLVKRLASLGFPDAVAGTIAKWRRGGYKALRTQRARKLFDQLLPELLDAFSRAQDPERTIALFDDFLSKLPAGVQIFSLFRTHPWVFQLIGRILSAAPSLAEELARRPDLLDFVLAPAFFESVPDKKELAKSLKTALVDAADYQDVLDITRRWAGEVRFQIGIHILESLLSVREAGRALSDLAEVVLAELLPRVIRDFAGRNGRIAKSEMAVIALGSFGGRELTLASDLDLVLLYDAPEDARAKSGKGLPASQYFIRLGQHFLTALNAMMGSGKLYEVDLRLRPSGRWGPLVVTLEAFVVYQKSSAWSWEHMALTRARPIIASKAFKKRIDKAIHSILTMERKPAKLARHMNEVRVKYYQEFGSENPYNARHVRGGLLDTEYVAQYHLLRRGHRHPGVFDPDFDKSLDNLVAIQSLKESEAVELKRARALLLQAHGLIRLGFSGDRIPEQLPSGLAELMAETAGFSSAQALASALRESEKSVYALYRAHILRYLEKRKKGLGT